MIKASSILTLALLAALGIFGLVLEDEEVAFVWSRTVDPGGTGGDVICIFCSADVRGPVGGDVITIFGNQVVDGKVSGDIIAVGGSIHLKSGARAESDVLSIGGTIHVDPAAGTSEPVEGLSYLHLPGQRSILNLGLPIALGGHMLLVILVAAVFRFRRVARLSDALSRRPWTCLAAGIPIGAAWILADELPGWLDVPIYLLSLLLVILWLLGYAAFGMLLGQRIQPAGNPGKQLVYGSLLLFFLLVIPVLGALFWAVVSMGSLGGSAVAIGELVGRRIRKQSTA